ncbi:hypothetical protein [Janthinobacterium fluminis]|uniref:DUF3618 domain-containing protein n=1 Tax=Janthinobacterium fluminis TaxID=2987524 RepID=A0ABT5K6K6_9BURK|nr:hypothetical protein [Janthinobacterium fluminis]MDC8760060.1 hypothetical protein [Janthinobacterium fluminis]
MSKEQRRAAQAAHKERLIAAGQLYRVGIVHARAQAAQALQPKALLRGAVERVAGYAGARVGTLLTPGGLDWKAALPYALPALGFITRKKLLKPALAAGVAVAAALAWLARRKR